MLANDAFTETENIRVIVFTSQASGGRIVHQSGTDARHLVRGNRNTDAGPANRDTQICGSADDGATHGRSEIGVVNGSRGIVGSYVNDVNSSNRERLNNGGLQVKAGVIGTYGYSHRNTLVA